MLHHKSPTDWTRPPTSSTNRTRAIILRLDDQPNIFDPWTHVGWGPVKRLNVEYLQKRADKNLPQIPWDRLDTYVMLLHTLPAYNLFYVRYICNLEPFTVLGINWKIIPFCPIEIQYGGSYASWSQLMHYTSRPYLDGILFFDPVWDKHHLGGCFASSGQIGEESEEDKTQRFSAPSAVAAPLFASI